MSVQYRLLPRSFCRFDAYAPRVFTEGAVIAGSGGIGLLVAALVMSIWRARETKAVTTYGSARWARVDEIRGAGLLGPDRVVLDRFGGQYLRHDGPSTCCALPRLAPERGWGLLCQRC